ncbi:MAG: hypothetical protein MJZ20_14385 [Bacteroidaceae bacterium]|nr:hypothetical protein [Bacteroidaceae bacterium]
MRQSVLTIVLSAILMSSCSTLNQSIKQPARQQPVTINLALVRDAQANKYVNLDYGIRLNVQDNRTNTELIQKNDAMLMGIPQVQVNPNVSSFVSESTRRYMRTMGFNLDSDVATDYMMQLKIGEFHVDYLSGVGWNGTVMMNLEVYDHSHKLVYPNVEIVGRATMSGSPSAYSVANQVINNAYVAALEDIDWDRIAYFLHRANSPQQEANKQVNGEGNTALEHLTVHWNINSRPQGADVYWRVISKTPDVKQQNYKYCETTPYETTETLNIKGLTYNNVGNVQIEVKCEKAGYYSQTKKYDILSVIDEGEVSYMFRLVKEEE